MPIYQTIQHVRFFSVHCKSKQAFMNPLFVFKMNQRKMRISLEGDRFHVKRQMDLPSILIIRHCFYGNRSFKIPTVLMTQL
jgi:hypothetical protein